MIENFNGLSDNDIKQDAEKIKQEIAEHTANFESKIEGQRVAFLKAHVSERQNPFLMGTKIEDFVSAASDYTETQVVLEGTDPDELIAQLQAGNFADAIPEDVTCPTLACVLDMYPISGYIPIVDLDGNPITDLVEYAKKMIEQNKNTDKAW